MRSIAITMLSLWVCLSDKYLKNHMCKLNTILMTVISMLCASSFVDDVMFSCNGQIQMLAWEFAA